MKKLLRKLRAARGETLYETLFSVLIISLAMMLLAGAIVTASRLNATAAETDPLLAAGVAGADGTVYVGEAPVNVTVYNDGRLVTYEYTP